MGQRSGQETTCQADYIAQQTRWRIRSLEPRRASVNNSARLGRNANSTPHEEEIENEVVCFYVRYYRNGTHRHPEVKSGSFDPVTGA